MIFAGLGSGNRRGPTPEGVEKRPAKRGNGNVGGPGKMDALAHLEFLWVGQRIG